MKQVFYAIDMGAPSATSSGFFCWKLDETGLESFEGIKGWYDCLSSILDTSRDCEVHLTIEAALWGMKDVRTGAWIRRFNLETKERESWVERPWYMKAGAATGLMAQEFLGQLIEGGLDKKIIVRESYISGLDREKSNDKAKKPKESIIPVGSDHSNDALEGLLLTLEDVMFDLKRVKNTFNSRGINLDNWINLKAESHHKIVIRDTESNKYFPIGILKNSILFDFKVGKILFTRRPFTFTNGSN